MNWYVIRVVTGKEKKTKDLIENELDFYKMTDKLTQILIPSKKVMQLRNGKKYAIEKNDFPGYILVECEEVPKELVTVIKNVNNVIEFLGDPPEPLRQREVDRILGRQQEEEIEDKFFVGEIVSIVDGPFTSFVGEVTSVDEKKKILKVDVKIFGRDVPVELTYLQVDKKS